MGWKDYYNRAKSEFENLVGDKDNQQQHQQHQQYPQQQYNYQQQQHFQPPPGPPPPGGPHDGPPPVPNRPSERYWQASFREDTPTNVEWDCKLGNTDGWGNAELQHYTAEPANSFHTGDGRLVLRALANNNAPSPEQRYTSARLVSRQTLAHDRGVLTAFITSPCATGIWPAFWLLPKEPFSWPTDGEVDIAETWNGDLENHSCLHWGHHHEPQKHRIALTKIPDMASRPVRYDFAWDQPNGVAGQGRMVWYVDGRPVMKQHIPEGTRPMRDMTILLNIAMGGNVCQGKTPADGYYDMIVQSLYMSTELDQGGWGRFDYDWGNPHLSEGNTY